MKVALSNLLPPSADSIFNKKLQPFLFFAIRWLPWSCFLLFMVSASGGIYAVPPCVELAGWASAA
jgi:hypothetical protein